MQIQTLKVKEQHSQAVEEITKLKNGFASARQLEDFDNILKRCTRMTH
jgi:hypothetical protein